MTDAPPTACVLIIGDEILSGRTQDANIQFFGQQLAAMGIRLKECRVIPDVPAAIVETLNTVRKLYTYVFTTGGIGPTHDDITTACVAQAFGRKVIREPKVVAAMKLYYGDKLNEARLQMANIPDGPDVALIENRISVAPGYRIENVFVMAGVPSIARAMFEAVAPTLKTGAPVYAQYVDGHVGEGDIADDLVRIQNAHPGITIGSYPFYRDNKLGTSIVARGTDKAPLASAIAQVAEAMRKLNGNPVFGPVP
jgi:molybdenum cofactor synthesis domain-containing protein